MPKHRSLRFSDSIRVADQKHQKKIQCARIRLEYADDTLWTSLNLANCTKVRHLLGKESLHHEEGWQIVREPWRIGLVSTSQYWNFQVLLSRRIRHPIDSFLRLLRALTHDGHGRCVKSSPMSFQKEPIAWLVNGILGNTRNDTLVSLNAPK
jgi:hypothetical protein